MNTITRTVEAAVHQAKAKRLWASLPDEMRSMADEHRDGDDWYGNWANLAFAVAEVARLADGTIIPDYRPARCVHDESWEGILALPEVDDSEEWRDVDDEANGLWAYDNSTAADLIREVYLSDRDTALEECRLAVPILSELRELCDEANWSY